MMEDEIVDRTDKRNRAEEGDIELGSEKECATG
jgi:hypothetical protein